MALDDQDPAEEARAERLAAGLEHAATGRGGWLDERLLAVLAGVLVPSGILLVLFGWYGASRTPNVYEQVPYLISGGQLGQTLALVGALCYFAHWLTALVREQRRQGAAVVDAITRLEEVVTRLLAGSGPGSVGEPGLVATARGTLAHRPGCAAVAGKAGLRRVGPADGMARCRLCASDDLPQVGLGGGPAG